MKTIVGLLFILAVIPITLMAQFNGGIGRGDIALAQYSSLLGGEDGLYAGGNGRGEYALSFGPSILNQDRIYVSGSNSADGYYHSLSSAAGAFGALNANSQTGKTITITIWGSSDSETGDYTLNAGSWMSVTIYPKITGLYVSGNPELQLIIGLNGADNVTVDGRLNAAGSSPNLFFPKTRLFNTAVNNAVKYININGELYVTETSTVSTDGPVNIQGDLKVENGSTLSNAPAGNLTVTGTMIIKP
ncbi:MAG: hypothetical protein NTW10_05495 [Bacteroidetes bacterium]|nr:hypothetical protein [Bacteroidota bacterium]